MSHSCQIGRTEQDTFKPLNLLNSQVYNRNNLPDK